MVERYKQVASQLKLRERTAKKGSSPLDAATVAGIVQAEGRRDPGHPKIARMIYNRFGARTPLQPDITVPYAQGRGTPEVSEKGTEVRSPYDTCFKPGLPPKPSRIPGRRH
ncbi:endolytic transglycosylase MltG [Streptosporangium sp. NBC_01469]|uniref:endolytic transglycosylase MltG n=1 Tax=unclassified Streptosporangium TaxID=2632669 RepID=UPI002E2E499A|nr:endolytic transglycosylase MltG [Streptosporangium sp. NBC_01469]